MSYGPALTVKRTEKYWPPSDDYRKLLKLWLETPNLKYMLKSFRPVFEAEELIKQPKFYGAEWIDSNI